MFCLILREVNAVVVLVIVLIVMPFDLELEICLRKIYFWFCAYFISLNSWIVCNIYYFVVKHRNFLIVLFVVENLFPNPVVLLRILDHLSFCFKVSYWINRTCILYLPIFSMLENIFLSFLLFLVYYKLVPTVYWNELINPYTIRNNWTTL